MKTISFRQVLVACAAVALLGFALPNVHALAVDSVAAGQRVDAAQRIDAPRDTTSEGAPTPTPAQAEPMQNNSCGDGRCSAPEDCNSCARDCGSCCGDRRCAPPEDCRSCPGDCGSC